MNNKAGVKFAEPYAQGTKATHVQNKSHSGWVIFILFSGVPYAGFVPIENTFYLGKHFSNVIWLTRIIVCFNYEYKNIVRINKLRGNVADFSQQFWNWSKKLGKFEQHKFHRILINWEFLLNLYGQQFLQTETLVKTF